MRVGFLLENGVPFVGPLVSSAAGGRRVVDRWFKACGLQEGGSVLVRAFLVPQHQGRYELVLTAGRKMLLRLPGFDELLAWRLLRAARSKGILVVTPLVGKNRYPLAKLEGLGLVLKCGRRDGKE
ncbi:hypothetical protein [Ammonifex thiophilus]|uniref:Uncharacterized protein n=1 Tax=Ammonifex thiophilus TaxID=444093 RepID=A0A3D8P7J2_9THEO|nr:hypothetical protein [Ammonifex thiophilus]RDV84618.1 hypothetical protein DXX99_00800 [Ammonifex thiophilus]